MSYWQYQYLRSRRMESTTATHTTCLNHCGKTSWFHAWTVYIVPILVHGDVSYHWWRLGPNCSFLQLRGWMRWRKDDWRRGSLEFDGVEIEGLWEASEMATWSQCATATKKGGAERMRIFERNLVLKTGWRRRLAFEWFCHVPAWASLMPSAFSKASWSIGNSSPKRSSTPCSSNQPRA